MQFRSTCKLNTVILMKILYFLKRSTYLLCTKFMDWWYFLPNYAEAKLADLEDRSCKNNLRINGIKEEYGKTLETSETKLQQMLKETLEIGKEIVIGCA